MIEDIKGRNGEPVLRTSGRRPGWDPLEKVDSYNTSPVHDFKGRMVLYVCLCVLVYVCVYMSVCLSMCVYICIYIYLYTHTHKISNVLFNTPLLLRFDM